MKILISVFSLLLLLPAYGQQIDTVILKAKYIGTPENKSHPVFEFTVHNISSRTIKFWKEPIVTDTSKYPYPEIIAEIETTFEKEGRFKVLYCSINPENTICPPENPDCAREKIKAGDSMVVTALLHCYSFLRDRSYKVRFALNAKRTGFYGKTEWLKFVTH